MSSSWAQERSASPRRARHDEARHDDVLVQVRPSSKSLNAPGFWPKEFNFDDLEIDVILGLPLSSSWAQERSASPRRDKHHDDVLVQVHPMMHSISWQKSLIFKRPSGKSSDFNRLGRKIEYRSRHCRRRGLKGAVVEATTMC